MSPNTRQSIRQAKPNLNPSAGTLCDTKAAKGAILLAYLASGVLRQFTVLRQRIDSNCEDSPKQSAVCPQAIGWNDGGSDRVMRTICAHASFGRMPHVTSNFHSCEKFLNEREITWCVPFWRSINVAIAINCDHRSHLPLKGRSQTDRSAEKSRKFVFPVVLSHVISCPITI